MASSVAASPDVAAKLHASDDSPIDITTTHVDDGDCELLDVPGGLSDSSDPLANEDDLQMTDFQDGSNSIISHTEDNLAFSQVEDDQEIPSVKARGRHGLDPCADPDLMAFFAAKSNETFQENSLTVNNEASQQFYRGLPVQEDEQAQLPKVFSKARYQYKLSVRKVNLRQSMRNAKLRGTQSDLATKGNTSLTSQNDLFTPRDTPRTPKRTKRLLESDAFLAQKAGAQPVERSQTPTAPDYEPLTPKSEDLSQQARSAFHLVEPAKSPAPHGLADRKGNTCVTAIESRYASDCGKLINGRWYIPEKCNRCKYKSTFCDRALPFCGNCQDVAPCIRGGGWILARRCRARPEQASRAEVCRKAKPTVKVVKASLEILPKSPKDASPAKAKKSNGSKPLAKKQIRYSNAAKPPGIGMPQVWSETRQELCEALPYFRAYQSGNYGHDRYMHGYLVDGFDSERDYMDGHVVITHSGGKSEEDPDGGRRLVNSQRVHDKTIECLTQNHYDKIPVAMVIGNECPTAPSRIPYRYAIMDWFKVTAYWAEKDAKSGKVRYKFRFEKLDTAAHGWWNCEGGVGVNANLKMEILECATCKQPSPYIYEDEWICTHPECADFWKVSSQGGRPPQKLIYCESFLHCKTLWKNEKPPSPLAPQSQMERVEKLGSGADVTRSFWKGMHCTKCGRLSCRELWQGWECRNCGHVINPPRTNFNAAELADPHRAIFTGPAVPENLVSHDVGYTIDVQQDHYRVMTYYLGKTGTVTHILANANTNARDGDADAMFADYQSLDLPFKRRVLKNHKSVGRMLTQQFTFNAGASYKYIVESDSVPFEDAPLVVNRALEVIRERVRLVHCEAEFNEILSVGYFQEQKMDYHDDGESDLADTVASVSLGCSAHMKFRIKKKYDKPSPEDALMLAPSTNMSDRLRGKDDETIAAMNKDDLQEELDEGGKPAAKKAKSRVILDLLLSHGDVIVMKGRDIQKFYEHAVIPTGLFRIAATARYIHPTRLVPLKSPKRGERLAESPEAILADDEEMTGTNVAIVPTNSSINKSFPVSPHQLLSKATIEPFSAPDARYLPTRKVVSAPRSEKQQMPYSENSSETHAPLATSLGFEHNGHQNYSSDIGPTLSQSLLDFNFSPDRQSHEVSQSTHLVNEQTTPCSKNTVHGSAYSSASNVSIFTPIRNANYDSPMTAYSQPSPDYPFTANLVNTFEALRDFSSPTKVFIPSISQLTPEHRLSPIIRTNGNLLPAFERSMSLTSRPSWHDTVMGGYLEQKVGSKDDDERVGFTEALLTLHTAGSQ